MNLNDQQHGADIASRFHRLMALDDIWTAYLETAASIPAPDIKRLRNLVDEIDGLLVSLHKEFKWMFAVASDNAADFDSVLAAAMTRAQLTTQQRRRVRARVRRLGPRGRAFRNLTSLLARRIPLERKELSQKIGLIEAGRHTPGDVSSRTKCLLSVAVLLGGYWCAPLIGAGVAGIISHCL
jgi:hypothetical protein